MNAAALAELLGGRLLGDGEARAERVVTDTRGALREGDVFVGIAGPRFDGSRFGARALDAGASVAVVTGDVPTPGDRQAVIVVGDGLAALHAMAASARDRLEGRVVAITGSNGKTTVKDLLVAALGRDARVDVSPSSWNSQVGVPLALLYADPKADWVVVECGVSEPGEMARLRQIVRPDAGVFVNVGEAHLEGFGSRDRIAEEKAQLFSALPDDGWVLVPQEEALAREAVERVVTSAALLLVPDLEGDAGEWLDDAARRHPGVVQSLRVAVALARTLGATVQRGDAGLRAWRPAPMRMEVTATPRGVVVINDAYTADPVTTEAALVALVETPSDGRAIAVLGEMAQLGPDAAEAHRRVGAAAARAGVDVVIGVGRGGGWIVDGARAAGLSSDATRHAPSLEDAARWLDSEARRGDRVLLKASRPERLERLVGIVFESVSPARLEIDLDAIVANVDAVRAFVGRGVGVMPVVKAFGYGLDAVPIARQLEAIGVDALCVAYPDEAVELRSAGVSLPVLVQNVLPAEMDKVVRHGASAQVATIEQVQQLAAEAARQARRAAVHLKVDTGMGRAGVALDDVPEVVARILASPSLALEGLMTHFAAADDPAHDAFTRQQIARFEQARAAARALGAVPRWEHACNSAGLVRFPEAHYSLVRLGIGLYAQAPREPGGPAWTPVVRLTTRVVSVREVAGGDPVGYGLSWRAPEQGARVAVIALGYGDGYPRSLSNRGEVRVRGVSCPIVGRVCMDVAMVDVSRAPGAEAGDEVVVYDDATGPTLADAAAAAGTIPYELLTRLSGRVRRVFTRSR